VELGWGGYWAWDAVENASLLPWFTGTALMHSLIVQQRRGTMKVWNIWLIFVTFLLCIFGTYLTRSGIIQSVHTFQPSSVGPFILEMLRVGMAFSIGVIIWRRCLLKSEHKVDKLVSYEGAFIAGNVLLVIIMLTTMVGTIYPVLSSPFGDEPVTLGKEFYNNVVVPMAVLLAALMAVGPLLRYANATGALKRRLIAPGVAAVAAIIVAGVCSSAYMNEDFWKVSVQEKDFKAAGTLWMLVCAGVTAFTVTCIAEDIIRTAGALRWATIRRWGGQLVHIGMVMIVIGVAGSSIFKTKKTMALKVGDAQQIGKYNVRLESMEHIDKDNYHADEARIAVSTSGSAEFILAPQQRRYHSRPKKLFSEVDVYSTVFEDVYITRSGSTEDGKIVHIEVVVSLLLLWIWIGGIAMSLGSLVCLVSPGIRRTRSAASPDVSPEACSEVPQ
jgi:cytochrome c-type biogenesis protein CcmF